ncbi:MULTISPECIES: DUF3597 domain-containing protein [unclassified Dyella]|uniref:DUF3597 domain-containing protein n=1 Tax=unclassified Dyella TaxID=2634549 RepID=UPI000C84C3FE|nr:MULTISPECIES: DUF3597 domain-containing protein [unclassified Dyella]MDR3446986.1 DUF3597 domain-containing protein [Dyella sp.]PMQ05873.1 hypothetical protein DyAD56_06405 [Dyella sp. AD56]
MSIFGTIVSKLFGKANAVTSTDASTVVTSAPAAPVAPEVVSPATATPSVTPLSGVDVAAVMDSFVSESGQKLDWRVSIVDMMKALGMDSSLDHRKQLAGELGYTGDTNDSASMNIWLHKEVLKALAANGGTLPAGLTS